MQTLPMGSYVTPWHARRQAKQGRRMGELPALSPWLYP